MNVENSWDTLVAVSHRIIITLLRHKEVTANDIWTQKKNAHGNI